ncbi:glycoside hydrolase [Penicillium angulare]|uniref:Glycoside hydrolase n=1 Tax=Penicillium angulare TaxID=116970 RepID=A0A9W9G845_9EURO|nr:glycoside hydrolase [Penicillium angulare]
MDNTQLEFYRVNRAVEVSSWIEPTNTTFNLWAVSDYWEPVNGTVTATWMTWPGKILNTTQYPLSLSGLDSTTLDIRSGWSEILPQGARSSDVVLLLNLTSHPTSDETVTFTSHNFLVPGYLSNSNLVDPGLKMSRVGNETWRVKATQAVAVYVWLSHPIGVTGFFNQNAILLAKGESMDFAFVVLKDTTNGSWVDDVRVRSMWDNWEF